MKSRFVLGAAVLILSSSFAHAQLNDRVLPYSGTANTGVVTAASPDKVKIGTREIEVNQIRLIQFGGEPRELTAARQRAIQGQVETALEAIKKIDRAAIKREPVTQDLLYYEAYCMAKIGLAGGGDKKAAGSKLVAFLNKYPQSYHFYEAKELMGHLSVALRNYKSAATFYAALDKAPWPDFKLRAKVLTGRAQIAEKDYVAAGKTFDEVVNSSIDSAEALRQKRYASVGKGVCLAEGGAIDEGVKMTEQIVSQNDPEDHELMGRAYNALGRCHRKAGRNMDALLAFLHVDLLYFNNPDIHAEALYNLSSLWAQANKSDRAISARNLLQTRYAGTRWASEN